MERNNTLQELCRTYLGMLRKVASKYGFRSAIDSLIASNERGECTATADDVEMLSRCVNDERMTRSEIPMMLNRSYRYCIDNEIFEKLKTLPRVGVYSRVHALLFKADWERDNPNNDIKEIKL